jgi:type II secretory pathway pseudopilin PulG
MTIRQRLGDERGESLLEVLIAVAIMGVAVVAIMAGLTTSVLMSDIHRKQSTAGAYVRDFAEATENSVAAGNYLGCSNSAGYAAIRTAPGGLRLEGDHRQRPAGGAGPVRLHHRDAVPKNILPPAVTGCTAR